MEGANRLTRSATITRGAPRSGRLAGWIHDGGWGESPLGLVVLGVRRQGLGEARARILSAPRQPPLRGQALQSGVEAEQGGGALCERRQARAFADSRRQREPATMRASGASSGSADQCLGLLSASGADPNEQAC